MDPVNLRGVDLNLLVVLDVLLRERHVTRAGRRLGLSQSATSNALDRLRALFEDPLLERVGSEMQLTHRAETLCPLLDQALQATRNVLGAAGTELGELRQTVRWSLVDYGLVVLGPTLLTSLKLSAPGLDLVVLPWTGADEGLAQLSRGELDFAVSVQAQGAGALRWRSLFKEHYVVAMRNGHPASRRFTLDQWLRYPHVLVSGRGLTTGALDSELASKGLQRRVGLVVPSFLAVPPILAESDLIALVPSRLLDASRVAITTRNPPIAVDPFEVAVAWHPRRDHDVATMHVVNTLSEVSGSFSRSRA